MTAPAMAVRQAAWGICRGWRPGVALLAGSLATACAVAQPAPAEPPASGPRLASKEHYRACRLAEQAIDRQRTQLQTRMDEHNQTAAQHQADSAASLQARQRKGVKTVADIAAYNQAVAQMNARTRELNQAMQGMLKAQQTHNDAVLQLNARCGNLFIEQQLADEVDAELGPRVRP